MTTDREPFIAVAHFFDLAAWAESFGVTDKYNFARLIRNYGHFANQWYTEGKEFKVCPQCKGQGAKDCERCGEWGFIQEPQWPGNSLTR